MQVSQLEDLLGRLVRSADGTELGTIGAVHVPTGNIQPLLVTFPAESPTPYAAPLFDAELTADALVLGYGVDAVTGGPTVRAETVLSAGEVYAVLDYYRPGLPRVRGGVPITDRDEDGIEPPGNRNIREILPIPSIGDGELPPIVVTRPGYTG